MARKIAIRPRPRLARVQALTRAKLARRDMVRSPGSRGMEAGAGSDSATVTSTGTPGAGMVIVRTGSDPT
ncbi:hypothetical protein Aut01nite_09400 [Actinoplanes utahensis]|nr:hypothetical protein Aut01nite_09400 [Actinoplanes utahensis]